VKSYFLKFKIANKNENFKFKSLIGAFGGIESSLLGDRIVRTLSLSHETNPLNPVLS
jgi:hypothetical protein